MSGLTRGAVNPLREPALLYRLSVKLSAQPAKIVMQKPKVNGTYLT